VKRLVLLTAIIGSLLLAGLSSSSIQASGCSDLQSMLANRYGGSCTNWHPTRDSWGTVVGARFNSGNTDTRLRAPRQGRLDTACGHIWSTQNVTRRIVVTEATWWKLGSHQHITRCALSPEKAAIKYRTGNGTAQYWHLLSGSENTGWHYDGPAVSIYPYHGHVDYVESDGDSACVTHQLPTRTSTTLATGWYFGGC
jgi:hypothetical protein